MGHTVAHPTELDWYHQKFFHGLDYHSVRRGKEVYEQVFAPCHSLNLLKFRHFEAFMAKEEVKEWAATVMVDDDEPDDEGNPRQREGKRFDYLPKPYPNSKAARFANNGALPPDLSLITNARHGGVDYIYALMTGYGHPIPTGVTVAPGQQYNPYFPGGVIGMPRPLSDDMIEYEDGTPASTEQMAKDVCVFLEWATNPFWDERRLIGIKAMATVAVIAVTSIWYNRFLSNLNRSRRVAFRALKYAK
eukprot:NODE_5769_length_911_cov_144.552030_g5544_i0.p1 GENE.NODE_5769_length_911_cov_144.552030_g5544_i0~~NODE_5769_length_911_cov_144.552030_g5544_i0.p1  ORF type:complete len:264 (-),score=74.90 NODE_5769_length_911_cov_144.552030_g5544_i0:118-858(-)